MKQERMQRARPQPARSPEGVEDVNVDESDTDLLNDIDDLLDEIDAVLEDQSTLTHYRQRSGQ